MNLTFSDIIAQTPFPSLRLTRQYGPWHLTIRTGTHCRFDSAPSNLPHHHERGHELCYVLGGTGQYDHGAESYTLTQGDLFLCDPSVMHEISSYDTRDLWLIFVVIFPEYQDQHGQSPASYPERLLHGFQQGHHIHRSNQHHLQPALLSLLSSADTQHHHYASEIALEQFTLMVIAALCQTEVPYHDTVAQSSPAQPEPPLLLQAIRLIDNRLDTPIQINEIADEIGCSPRHLTRLCQQHRQQSLLDLIQTRRMSHAARLLLMNLPVTEVARRLGIEHLSQFSRQFKRLVGESPKSFQAKYHTRISTDRASWI